MAKSPKIWPKSPFLKIEKTQYFQGFEPYFGQKPIFFTNLIYKKKNNILKSF